MDRNKSGERFKTHSVIEKGAQSFLDKFDQIDQIFEKLEGEELGVRDKLHGVIQDLTEEVNQAEQKHRKIQEFVRSFKDS